MSKFESHFYGRRLMCNRRETSLLLISGLKPPTNVLILSSSSFTNPFAYLDSWVNLLSVTVIWLCCNSWNSSANLSLTVLWMYFLVNLSTKNFQVISSPVFFAFLLTISHQCSASFWNMKVENNIFWSSVHFIAFNIFSFWWSHFQLVVGLLLLKKTGRISFWNCSRARWGLLAFVTN